MKYPVRGCHGLLAAVPEVRAEKRTRAADQFRPLSLGAIARPEDLDPASRAILGRHGVGLIRARVSGYPERIRTRGHKRPGRPRRGQRRRRKRRRWMLL